MLNKCFPKNNDAQRCFSQSPHVKKFEALRRLNSFGGCALKIDRSPLFNQATPAEATRARARAVKIAFPECARARARIKEPRFRWVSRKRRPSSRDLRTFFFLTKDSLTQHASGAVAWGVAHVALPCDTFPQLGK